MCGTTKWLESLDVVWTAPAKAGEGARVTKGLVRQSSWFRKGG